MRRLIYLPLLAFAFWSCEQTATQPTASEEATIDAPAPNFAVVDQWHSNGKAMGAYGYGRDYYYPYNYAYYDVYVYDFKYKSDKYKRMYVYLYSYYPYRYCDDYVDLELDQYGWNFDQPWVKAMTRCGLVDVQWQRISDIYEGEYDYWTGATDNCSPPEGQYSYHYRGSGKWAYGNATGTVGWVTVPVVRDYYYYNYARINKSNDHRTVCGTKTD